MRNSNPRQKSGLLGKLVLAGALGLSALGLGGRARGDDLVSFSQIFGDPTPPAGQNIYNEYDHIINNETPNKIASLGFLKVTPYETYVVGSAINYLTINGELYPLGTLLAGSYNGNPSTTEPSDDKDCLVMNEKPSALLLLYDNNGNNKFGSYQRVGKSYILDIEDGESYYNFIINGEIVPVSESTIPAFTGPSAVLPPITSLQTSQKIMNFQVNPKIVDSGMRATATGEIEIKIPEIPGRDVGVSPPRMVYDVLLEGSEDSIRLYEDEIENPEWGQIYNRDFEKEFYPYNLGECELTIYAQLTDTATSFNNPDYFHFDVVEKQDGPILLKKKGDVDGNGCVNISDLVAVRVNLGVEGSTIEPPGADIDGNGVVNVSDLVTVRTNLGEECAEESSSSKEDYKVYNQRALIPKRVQGGLEREAISIKIRGSIFDRDVYVGKSN